MKTYVVVFKAYGRVSVMKFEAEEEAEAVSKAMKQVGFSINVKEANAVSA